MWPIKFVPAPTLLAAAEVTLRSLVGAHLVGSGGNTPCRDPRGGRRWLSASSGRAVLLALCDPQAVLLAETSSRIHLVQEESLGITPPT